MSLFLQESRHEATLAMWQLEETYVSALLRAILYSDDATYVLDAYRLGKLDPIPSPEGQSVFSKQRKPCFQKAGLIVINVTYSLNLMS
jgi:hypothetical protein